MTPAERTEHQTRMRSMKTHEECKTYTGQHHEQMAAREGEGCHGAGPTATRSVRGIEALKWHTCCDPCGARLSELRAVTSVWVSRGQGGGRVVQPSCRRP
jgi:hypothetical protein